ASAHILGVGKRLASALGELLDTVAAEPRSPKQIATRLGVNKDTSHRLVNALRKKDPLAVIHLVPGPEPLRRVVKACAKNGVPRDRTQAAEEAIGAFAKLIQQEGGDRSGLDAIISAWLPSARARFESSAKQLGYRAMRQLKGVAADVTFNTVFLHPGSSPTHLDGARLDGFVGARCVRPGGLLKIGQRSIVTVPHPGAEAPRTLEGEPIEGLSDGLLRRFCSGPEIKIEVRRTGKDVLFMLDWGGALGLSSARDVVMAEVRRNIMRRYRAPDDGKTRSGGNVSIDVPTRVLICDYVLHRDAYPDWEPNVRVLELGAAGMADVNDESREADIVDVVETVKPMGTGIERFRCEQIPRYTELLQYACDKLGWNPQEFRGYRCQVEYPIFGTQLQFIFPVPIAPSEPTTSA
ncbi:MAG: hypothetical protein JXO22_12720, partial [Phycisphaerae bacterium]|nr:hypothetical protein [Phycisphaerae bacterium]